MQKLRFFDILMMFANALFFMRLVFTSLLIYILFRLTLAYLTFETLATLWPDVLKLDTEVISDLVFPSRMAILAYLGYTYIIKISNVVHDRLNAGEYICRNIGTIKSQNNENV